MQIPCGNLYFIVTHTDLNILYEYINTVNDKTQSIDLEVRKSFFV